jgi:hypothetical protein
VWREINDDVMIMGKKGFSVTFSVLVDILNFGRFSFSGVLVVVSSRRTRRKTENF